MQSWAIARAILGPLSEPSWAIVDALTPRGKRPRTPRGGPGESECALGEERRNSPNHLRPKGWWDS
eukprot:2135115-Pyramimonas_sp.AAC.1